MIQAFLKLCLKFLEIPGGALNFCQRGFAEIGFNLDPDEPASRQYRGLTGCAGPVPRVEDNRVLRREHFDDSETALSVIRLLEEKRNEADNA